MMTSLRILPPLPLLRLLRCLAAVLLLTLLGACATRDAPALDVQLAAVRLTDVQLLEQRLVLTLRFTNRTDRDVTVDGLTYKVDINGREFASGVSNQSFTVPRFAEYRLDVTATSSLSGLLAQVEELQKRASGPAPLSLNYRLSGRANAGVFGIGFDAQSELPVPVAAR